jgi:hypothetical protein
MKKLILSCFMALSLFGIPSNSFSMEPVRIDVLFMNHGPMRPTLRDLKDLFSRYAGKIAVSDYDSESEEGEAFKSKMMWSKLVAGSLAMPRRKLAMIPTQGLGPLGSWFLTPTVPNSFKAMAITAIRSSWTSLPASTNCLETPGIGWAL